jgi:transcriptional regulator with XRE-family HTH domain
VGEVVRPAAGWLRTVREALGLTLADLAKRLGNSPPAVRSFEQAEAEDRITLASLRRAAAAMGCDVIYVLVPRTGNLAELAAPRRPPRRQSPAETPTPAAPPFYTPGTENPDARVIDMTWRALHGDS